MVVGVNVPVVVLVGDHIEHVAMAAMNIDVLMFSIRYMGVRMTQWRQH